MGEVPPQGSIKFKGHNIAGLPSYRIAHLGLGYVPENRDIFPRLCDGPRPDRIRGHTRRTQGQPGGVPRMARSLIACADPKLINRMPLTPAWLEQNVSLI